MWDRIWDSDVGSDGKQRGLEALQTVYAAETAWGQGHSVAVHVGG